MEKWGQGNQDRKQSPTLWREHHRSVKRQDCAVHQNGFEEKARRSSTPVPWVCAASFHRGGAGVSGP